MVATVLLGVGALLFALITHEAAHAVMLRRLGIGIQEVGLGVPLPPRLVLRPRRVPFGVSLSPWLLGAYVQPHADDKAKLESLSYQDKARFYGAGCVVNLVAGGLLTAIGAAAGGSYVLAAVALSAAVVIACWPRPFVAFAAPLLGLVVLGALVYFVFLRPTALGSAGTMVNSADQFTSSSIDVTRFVGAVSLSLGIVNLAPVLPLDGGKIVDGFLAGMSWGRAVRKTTQSLGIAFFLTLMTVSVVMDVLRLF